MLHRLRGFITGGAAALPSRARRVVPLAEYDRNLGADLTRLPRVTQAAFAAACAERLQPAYVAFVAASGLDDGGLVRRTLDLAWDAAEAGAVDAEVARVLVEQCVAVIPSDETGLDVGPAHASDAISSAAYALQSAAGLDDKAARWAAQVVMDCLDDYLLSNEIDSSAPGFDLRVWEHPLVVAEIDRRKDDLRRLDDPLNRQTAVAAVRARASGVSALPLDRLSHES